MRNWITFLMTLLVGSTLSYANANMGEVSFEAGYRHDDYSWKHEFPSSNPTFSTKSDFKDVDIFQIGVEGRTTVGYNFYMRGNAYWGWVLDGNFKQSASVNGNFAGLSFSDSFSGNNFGISSSNRNIVDDRYVFGVGAAIGYPFFFCDCSMAVAPVIGYGFDQQTLRAYNTGVEGLLGETTCCESHFANRWYGPFVGVDFLYRACDSCWDLYGNLEYHWGRFSGRTNNAVGFTFGDRSSHRRSCSHAWVFGVGADYDLGNCWTAGLSLKFQDWKADKHHDDFFGDSYYSSYDESGRSRTKHKWHSYAVNLTVGHTF